MKNVVLELEGKDSGIVSILDETIERLEKVEKQLGLTQAAQVASDKELDKSFNALKRQAQAQNEYDKALKNTIENQKFFGVSLNDIKSKFAPFGTGLKNLTKSSKLLSLAMKSIPIVALVAALGSVVSFLKSTQRGSEILSKVWGGLAAITELVVDKVNDFGQALFDVVTNPRKALDSLVDFIKSIPQLVLDNIITRFQAMGKLIQAVVDLDFKTAGKAAVDAFTGVENTVDKVSDGVKDLGKEIAETVKKSNDLQNAKLALKKAEIELTKSFRETRAEIKELNKEAENTNNSYDVRKQKIQEAYELEQKLLQERLKVAEENLRVTRADIALNSDGDKIESLEKVAEAEARVAEIKLESYEQQTTLQNRLNTITKEQQSALKALSDQYETLNNELLGQLGELETEKLDPVQRLAKQRDIAIKSLEEQKDALIAAAKAIGKPVDEIEDSFGRLIGAVQEKYDKDLKDFQPKFIQTLKEIDYSEATNRSLEGIAFDIKYRPEIEDEGILDAFSDVFKSIKGVFDSEEFKEIFGGVREAFDQFASLYTEGIDAEIEKIDELSEKRKEDIEALKNDIAEAEDLRKQGFNVNVEQKKAQLETLQQQEEEDQKKKEELLAKQQRVQLISDSITQASSLITASGNILKGFSAIPIIGYGLGVAAIAAMFGYFAKLKVDAFKATRLFTGADSLFEGIGQIAPGEASDIPGRGDGFRVVDSEGKTRARVGGNEMLIDEKTTHSHGGVMRWIRDHSHKMSELQMINMLEGSIAPAAARLEREVATSREITVQRDLQARKDGYKEAMREVLAEQTSDMLTGIERISDRKGDRFTVNGKTYVRTRS